MRVENIISSLSLNTVCDEANCPNRAECFSRGTATFMILGRLCTRHCKFCNVVNGVPGPVDAGEPVRVAKAVAEMKLRYAVITSVTRDDLRDGGAGHFAAVIGAIREAAPGTGIEVLIPDFRGAEGSIECVVMADPDVINHNIETVPRLYSTVRPEADYARSLDVLRTVKRLDPGKLTKSGIMVGLGESRSEVLAVFNDLRAAGCDLLTVGQYLSPSKAHLPVVEYIHPDDFEKYRIAALEAGFRHVASSPLVRSSYMAENMLERCE